MLPPPPPPVPQASVPLPPAPPQPAPPRPGGGYQQAMQWRWRGGQQQAAWSRTSQVARITNGSTVPAPLPPPPPPVPPGQCEAGHRSSSTAVPPEMHPPASCQKATPAADGATSELTVAEEHDTAEKEGVGGEAVGIVGAPPTWLLDFVGSSPSDESASKAAGGAAPVTALTAASIRRRSKWSYNAPPDLESPTQQALEVPRDSTAQAAVSLQAVSQEPVAAVARVADPDAVASTSANHDDELAAKPTVACVQAIGFSLVDCPASGFGCDIYVHRSVADPQMLSRKDIVACRVQMMEGGPTAAAPFWRLEGTARSAPLPQRFAEYDGIIAETVISEGSMQVECEAIWDKYGRQPRLRSSIMTICGLRARDRIGFHIHIDEATGVPEVAPPVWRVCDVFEAGKAVAIKAAAASSKAPEPPLAKPRKKVSERKRTDVSEEKPKRGKKQRRKVYDPLDDEAL
eukprot:TRINITY_DN38280_c0_g1_i1.p1 TRINITY_DN38280_c0_g1~~TRINITY_DN38280_c0_g1_i1.p1  ORF type:complete len:459 (-),score=105.53 TRINITY_DN38280_c0_g1_i1:96-1472(-)